MKIKQGTKAMVRQDNRELKVPYDQEVEEGEYIVLNDEWEYVLLNEYYDNNTILVTA